MSARRTIQTRTRRRLAGELIDTACFIAALLFVVLAVAGLL